MFVTKGGLGTTGGERVQSTLLAEAWAQGGGCWLLPRPPPLTQGSPGRFGRPAPTPWGPPAPCLLLHQDTWTPSLGQVEGGLGRAGTPRCPGTPS